MSFKQKARKKNDGSSSSVPTKKDLASKYKALFPIYTTEEGKHFKRLTKSSFTGFPKNGFASKPKGWNAASVWEMLTGQSSFNAQNAGNKWICNTHRPIPENQTVDATIGAGAPSYVTIKVRSQIRSG
ncbi:hypothetical protein JCGZ_12801 [Jatropha curcas]|uniref:Uncharacterized protein n=1 Tax=Jatropha curcas TaxID=180498 RepID=A0A067KE56_JATCU|nr:hypothetical protein JCGZ_12801 [Jatropha curcas]